MLHGAAAVATLRFTLVITIIKKQKYSIGYNLNA